MRRHLNPEGLDASVMDAGKAAALGAGAGLAMGAVSYAAVKAIPDSPNAIMYGVPVVGFATGAAMQHWQSTALFGKILVGLAVGVPLAAKIMSMVVTQSGSAPVMAAAPSGYLPGFTVPQFGPSGALPDFRAQFTVPAYRH